MEGVYPSSKLPKRVAADITRKTETKNKNTAVGLRCYKARSTKLKRPIYTVFLKERSSVELSTGGQAMVLVLHSGDIR